MNTYGDVNSDTCAGLSHRTPVVRRVAKKLLLAVVCRGRPQGTTQGHVADGPVEMERAGALEVEPAGARLTLRTRPVALKHLHSVGVR